MYNASLPYHEKIQRFGTSDSLVGVLTQPDTDGGKNCPAAIFLNAGLLHRVGNQRMHVELSRKLAQMGVSSFRVDLYGVGESCSQSGDKSFRQRAIDDIREAMTFLSTKLGIAKFILVGHCAGADNAHPVMVMDDRVAGGVFIDGFGYPTVGFKLRDIGGPSMVNPIRWAKYCIKRILKLFRPISKTITFEEQYGRYWPSQSIAEKELMKVTKRGGKLLFIYTGGVPMYYNYASQFRKMFKSLKDCNSISLSYFNQADHNLTELSYRKNVFNTIISWVNTEFAER